MGILTDCSGRKIFEKILFQCISFSTALLMTVSNCTYTALRVAFYLLIARTQEKTKRKTEGMCYIEETIKCLTKKKT